MKRAIVIAALLAFTVRAQDAAPWWGALAADSAAFSPLSIGGCSLWLDASDAVTITHADGVASVWADKSPNAHNAFQTDPTKRPVYEPGYLLFKDGPFMWATNTALTRPFTVFLVADAVNYGLRILSGYEYNSVISLNRSDGNCIYMRGRVYSPALVGQTSTSHIVCLQAGSSAASVFFDGETKAENVSNANDFGRLMIGKGGWSVESTFAKVREIIAFNKVLSGSERKLIEAFFAEKWDITTTQ